MQFILFRRFTLSTCCSNFILVIYLYNLGREIIYLFSFTNSFSKIILPENFFINFCNFNSVNNDDGIVSNMFFCGSYF